MTTHKDATGFSIEPSETGYYVDPASMTPDEMHDRTPVEDIEPADRAICGMCGWKGCFDCLETGTERTRDDFLRDGDDDND